MHSNRFWELLAKQLSGEITPEELQELNYLKGEDEFLPYDNALLQAILSLTFHAADETIDTAKSWNHLQQKISAPEPATKPVKKSPVLKRLLQYAAAAASVAFIMMLGWHFLKGTPAATNRPNVFSSRNGSRSKIQMPDGTQVWLNAGSSLQYDNDTYGDFLREVTLVGEAYFDVTKDAGHPFVIHTKTLDVKVIGTTFNVRAYPNEKTTQAALIKGTIEVSFPGRPTEKLFLKPNEKITVSNTASSGAKKATNQANPQVLEKSDPIIVLSTIAYEPVDSAVIETAWTQNKLVFRSKTFEELAQDMERWYNVSIRFKDSTLMQRRLTGTFYNETIFEALDFLKMSSPFQYHFNKAFNTVTLYR